MCCVCVLEGGVVKVLESDAVREPERAFAVRGPEGEWELGR